MFEAVRASLPPNRAFLRRPLWWLVVCVLLSAFLLVYPIYVIQPFRYQGPRELAVALTVLRYRPVFEVLSVSVCLLLLALAWRQTRTWGRAAAALCAVVIVGFAVLSRVNVYEILFHPLESPSFSPASRAKLKDQEMVIAVRLRGQARAYPIRSMSYHHIVNDVVGGLPVVATY
jgi:hypothetical protein